LGVVGAWDGVVFGNKPCHPGSQPLGRILGHGYRWDGDGRLNFSRIKFLNFRFKLRIRFRKEGIRVKGWFGFSRIT